MWDGKASQVIGLWEKIYCCHAYVNRAPGLMGSPLLYRQVAAMAANLESFKPFKNTQSAGIYQINVQSRAWGLWYPLGHMSAACSLQSMTEAHYSPGFIKHRLKRSYGKLEVQLYTCEPSAAASHVSRFPFGQRIYWYWQNYRPTWTKD